MDIFSITHNLLMDHWEARGKPPEDIAKLGYEEYHLVKAQIEDDHITYYLSTDSGEVKTAHLYFIKSRHDPLKEINKCHLKLQGEKGAEIIRGIAFDRDWVESKE